MKQARLISIVTCIFVLALFSEPALCWSNGSYSSNPSQPSYGTHDWIAQHALDWLPNQEKKYIIDNLQAYLYGTELPDNSAPVDGIGDTGKHHVYYTASGTVSDNASAQRAKTEYNQALVYLKAQQYADAAKTVGIMTHYIADLAVFGHVMGASTAWRAETHHSDYEDHVKSKTTSYTSTYDSYLVFDGNLQTLQAYDAALNLAYDTTFGGINQRTCVWMDDNYDWSDAAFSGRCGESLNLAVNAVADVLHTLYQEAAASQIASPTNGPSPTVPEFSLIPILAAIMLATAASTLIYRKKAIQPALRGDLCGFAFNAIVHLV